MSTRKIVTNRTKRRPPDCTTRKIDRAAIEWARTALTEKMQALEARKL